MPRPSEPLLKLLRDALQKRGLSTSELAARTSIDRGELKRKLSGVEDLTVDQFLALATALELQKDLAGLVGVDVPQGDEAADDEAPRTLHSLPTASAAAADPSPPPGPDPLANPAEELLKGGFAWGLDMMVHFDAKQLGGSGVPESVLRKFPEALPIRFDPRFHRHNQPRYSEEGVTVYLSFDAKRECTFPWSAFRAVQFTIPPEAVAPAPPPPEPTPPPRPVLRLVRDE